MEAAAPTARWGGFGRGFGAAVSTRGGGVKMSRCRLVAVSSVQLVAMLATRVCVCAFAVDALFFFLRCDW